MYADVTVVVDGALDREEVARTDAEVDAIVAEVEKEAREDGLPTEVYVLWHEHAEDVEDCACAQYVTDHHPARSFNMEE